MKKLLLSILFLTTASTLYAAKEIYELDMDGSVRVKCISGYVFVVGREGGVTQFMYWSEEHNTIKPAQCGQYGR